MKTNTSTRLIILAAAATLYATTSFAASQSIVSTGTVTVHNRDYQTITRAFNQDGGNVITGEVRVAQRSWGCNPRKSGDCERVVQRVLDSSQIRGTTGVAASQIREVIARR